MAKGPVKGTQIAGGRYYLVEAQGPKRIWHPLTKVKEGLPAFYRALAEQLATIANPETMPAAVTKWCMEVMSKHAPKTQVDEQRRANDIAAAFQDFAPREVETPDAFQFLRQFDHQHRTYDAYRSQLRSVFRYCELWGLRPAGSNPVDAIPTKGYKPRKRYITDSHLRRIKVAGLYGDDGRRNPSGLVFCCLVELLYLTGADVSVVVRILEQADPGQPDEPHVCTEGLMLRRDKTDGSSRPVIVGWTPRLRAVVARLQALKVERRSKKRMAQRVETPRLITKVDGTPMNYEAFSNSWQRAMKRAVSTGKVPPTMIRDLRAKAATDKEESHGMGAASDLMDHTTQTQTAAYVRRKKVRRVQAVR
jgi:integrase